jgi:hypothetical protein
MTNVKMLEFKINIQDTPKEYIDGLILGLVHSGYSVYTDMEKENVCFNGWADEVITQKIIIPEGVD